MRILPRLLVAASAAALLLLPVGLVLAQGAPGGTAPAEPPAAAPAPPPPAAAPPAAAPSTPAPEAAVPEKSPQNTKSAQRKKKPAKRSRQQEIDHSIESGTVPARYRSSVPKEYHQYIPFDKR